MKFRPLYPGVYFLPVQTNLHPVAPVQTSIVAFIGHAQSGPLNQAVIVHSFLEYESQFGGLTANSEMSYAVLQFFNNGGSDAWVVRVAESDLGLDDYNHIVGSESGEDGLFALNRVDLINILCLPGVTNPAILLAATAYCRKRRAFMIVDAPQGASVKSLAASIADYPNSSHVAVYYPWLKIPDPLNHGQLRLTSTVGSIAGIYAATDNRRGVWKSPAGVEAKLSGVQDLELNLTTVDNRSLNTLHVNCLRLFTRTGPVVWGARTSNMLDYEYKYIGAKRLALFLEESLYRGTRWAVFEPNTETLWSRITGDVTNFMQSLFRQGAFAGSKSSEAFFVRCDRSTHSEADILEKKINILIGFAPQRPAEFTILRIQQKQ